MKSQESMKILPRKVLRRMGFLRERQGLIDRYIHVDNAWEDHLLHTRNFIRTTVSGRKINNLAIMGSGWMLDLPVEDIIEYADHIWLYDIIHPRQILHKVKRYPQITVVSSDITGGAMMKSWDSVRHYKRTGNKTTPEEICSQAFFFREMPDYVISLNTLSQIGSMITDYLQQHIPYSSEELTRIHFLLQSAHLQLLTPGSSCFVTDVQELEYDFNDVLQEKHELINIALPDSGHAETWDWQFDPTGGYKPGRKTILKVMAFEMK